MCTDNCKASKSLNDSLSCVCFWCVADMDVIENGNQSASSSATAIPHHIGLRYINMSILYIFVACLQLQIP